MKVERSARFRVFPFVHGSQLAGLEAAPRGWSGLLFSEVERSRRANLGFANG